jgi:hypothetical protein
MDGEYCRGSKGFVEKTKAELGIKAIGREVMGAEGVYELREHDVSYNLNSAGENRVLRPENAWHDVLPWRHGRRLRIWIKLSGFPQSIPQKIEVPPNIEAKQVVIPFHRLFSR